MYGTVRYIVQVCNVSVALRTAPYYVVPVQMLVPVRTRNRVKLGMIRIYCTYVSGLPVRCACTESGALGDAWAGRERCGNGNSAGATRDSVKGRHSCPWTVVTYGLASVDS